MKITHFIFDDFWRKLVALIFAVVIYWQVGESVKKNSVHSRPASARPSYVGCEHVVKDFTVRMLDGGIAARRVFFAGESAPEIRATLRGTKGEIGTVRDGDVVFYVDGGEFDTDKTVSLPVRWQIRRPGIGVVDVTPAEIKVFTVRNTEKTIK